MSKCPKCKKPMRWQEGLLTDSGSRDTTVGREYCSNCNLRGKPTESIAVSNGKRLAKNLRGVRAMDKRITQHSSATQIGILRALQHCATCGQPTYPTEGRKERQCHCKACGCPYCDSMR